MHLQSVKKISFGNCQPIILACSVITNIWQPSYNSFSDKQLEIMACDRSFPPVGPNWRLIAKVLGLGQLNGSLPCADAVAPSVAAQSTEGIFRANVGPGLPPSRQAVCHYALRDRRRTVGGRRYGPPRQPVTTCSVRCRYIVTAGGGMARRTPLGFVANFPPARFLV